MSGSSSNNESAGSNSALGSSSELGPGENPSNASSRASDFNEMPIPIQEEFLPRAPTPHLFERSPLPQGVPDLSHLNEGGNYLNFLRLGRNTEANSSGRITGASSIVTGASSTVTGGRPITEGTSSHHLAEGSNRGKKRSFPEKENEKQSRKSASPGKGKEPMEENER